MAISSGLGVSAIKPGVVDSAATRPASPYEGQVIFQKDTDQLLVWNGTAWVIPNSPAQNPDGLALITKGTFTGITSAAPLVLSNILTTDYPHYRVTLSWTQSTAGGWLNMRLRNSSGLIDTATYDGQRFEHYSTTTGASGSLSGSSWGQLAYNYNIGFYSYFTGDITYATVNQPTFLQGRGGTKRTGGGGAYMYVMDSHGYQDQSTIATGFNIYPDGGTIAGNYEIYGYRK